jgi:carboxypeptidase Taq
MSATTDALSALHERLAPLADLRGLLDLLQFDRETAMPPAGGGARAEQVATVSAIIHDGMADPRLAELLEEAREAELTGDEAALVRVVTHDADKARRVPQALVRELALAASAGQEAWATARADDDFASFQPFLERNVELRREYAACFDVSESYDALLDDYEPGMLTSEVQAVFDPLREELPALVAAAGERGKDAPDLAGPFPIDGQRRAVDVVLRRVGFDESSWRLADSTHPFSASPGHGDNRITTRFSEANLDSIPSALHEFGHGLYEAQVDPDLARSALGRGVSMAVHESQSRLWELFVGMSVPFWRGLWPAFVDALGAAPGGLGPEEFVAATGRVKPSLIRVESDPVSYPLHIVLRFELERALIEDRLAVADLPGAWRDSMRDLLGIDVPDDRQGVLQDVHWAFGAFGYFPTYALGTILAAQIWDVAASELEGLDAELEAGELGPLRDWLRERIHHHGKRLEPRELIRAATGRDLDAGPYLAYARGR